jgi:IS5 family transposase
MRQKKHETTGAGDLFRARLDQIINLKHELVQLAGKIDWAWIDGEIAPLFSDKGRPATSTRFVIGLLLLKHIFALSDEQVCERWVYDPYFQYFTGAEFFTPPARRQAGAAVGREFEDCAPDRLRASAQPRIRPTVRSAGGARRTTSRT